jgi:predicted ATPase
VEGFVFSYTFAKNNKKMLKVGITGGIGSGKTTVCQIFEKLGVPVYYARSARQGADGGRQGACS